MAKDIGLPKTPPAGAIVNKPVTVPVVVPQVGAVEGLQHIKAEGDGPKKLWHVMLNSPLPQGAHQAEVEAADEHAARAAFFKHFGITHTVNSVAVTPVEVAA